jgi:hypothetical protein
MGQFAQYKNISVQMMVSKSAPWQPIILNGANDDNTQRFTGIDYLNVDTLNVATSDLLDIFNIQGSAGMSSNFIKHGKNWFGIFNHPKQNKMPVI